MRKRLGAGSWAVFWLAWPSSAPSTHRSLREECLRRAAEDNGRAARSTRGPAAFAWGHVVACLVMMLFTTVVRAAEPAGEGVVSGGPEQREMWVPANRLKEILAKYPNAVVLSREQYETLVNDASEEKKPEKTAPRRAALTEARYEGRIAGKVVQVTAVLTVQVLEKEWAEVPLGFAGATVGTVNVDGEAALIPETPGFGARASTKANPATAPMALLLRGRGERKVTVEFTVPIAMEAGLNRLRLALPAAAASTFVLDLPANQRVESPQPISIIKVAAATKVTAALAPANPALELSWRGAGDAAQALEPLVLVNGIYTIDAEKVRGEFGFAVETQLGSLPVAFQIPLPANVKVLQVTGDELAQWAVANGKLAITLQAGERSTARFWLALEMPSLAAAPQATLAPPVPRIEGLARMQGVFSIVGDAGVTIERVTTDNTATLTDRAIDLLPYFVASYKFLTPPAGPQVTVERVQPRFSADLDTLVEFRREAIYIERTLTLHREKGDVFSTALTLPAGEEVLSVRAGNDTEPDWRMEGGKLRLRWGDLAEQTGSNPTDRVFKIRTRIEPEKWTQMGPEGLKFVLGDAVIDGAEKVSGYIALQADPAFRLEAEASDTLERRDGRTTPIRGDYAWFRRADFALSVKVVKRPGEVLAALIGYALPLEGVLDLHAQMNYQFLYSGARSVRVRVPKALAANFNFDGPQIAERNLVDDVWTIVFQKELTGDYALKITTQVPVSSSKDAAESRFKIAVPVIAPLDVVRASGVWSVEANTETEITFEAKGMNELDSLLAPPLEDYSPRHRVIGVFGWLGADYTLTLSGVRHAPAEVLSSVVDQLTLETVVSTSGTERSQATFQIRTAGAQYLDVRLPEKSRLLSLAVDGDLVKPVGGSAGQVRVQLPARQDATSALTVSVLYETPQREWGSSGGYEARAPQLARDIPILRSQWRLYLPDGFEYNGIESNLQVSAQPQERPLVVGVFRAFGGGEARRSVAQAQMESIQQEDRPSVEPRIPAINRKLERIVLPQVDFRNATIREAIDYLKRKSVELDQDDPKTGVNMVLKLDTGGTGDGDERITLSLSNIPLIEALNYVTRLANLKFKVEPSGVFVVPLNVPLPSDQGDTANQNQIRSMVRKLERTVLPRVEFKDVTIREAIDYLRRKSVELDQLDPKTGVNMVLKLDSTGPGVSVPDAGVPPIPGLDNRSGAQESSEQRITVSLSNIPLGEALKYITGLANLKYKVEPYAVYIVPLSVRVDSLITKEWKVRPDLIPRAPERDGDATRGGSGIADRESAKNWLIANGVQFNDPGAAAIYIPSTGRLIVRNTSDQLDLLETMVSASAAYASAPAAAGDSADANAAVQYGIAGLVPMNIELPKAGGMVVLKGLSAAQQVEFHYHDWWSRARRLWLWFVAGGLVALFVAQERPWWRTCWVVLGLTFFPLVVSPGWTAVCNAVLAGWLVSVVIQRFAARFVFARAKRRAIA